MNSVLLDGGVRRYRNQYQRKEQKIVEVYREEYQPEGITAFPQNGRLRERKNYGAAPLIPNYTGTEIKKNWKI